MKLSSSPEPIPNVITSYSIHYTKLYDNMNLVKTTQKDNVNIGGYNFQVWSADDESIYQNYNKYYVETYTIPGAVGEWELSILPKNTRNNFV